VYISTPTVRNRNPLSDNYCQPVRLVSTVSTFRSRLKTKARARHISGVFQDLTGRGCCVSMVVAVGMLHRKRLGIPEWLSDNNDADYCSQILVVCERWYTRSHKVSHKESRRLGSVGLLRSVRLSKRHYGCRGEETSIRSRLSFIAPYKSVLIDCLLDDKLASSQLYCVTPM